MVITTTIIMIKITTMLIITIRVNSKLLEIKAI